MCKAGGIAGAKREGKQWLVPVTWDSRLCGVNQPEHLAEQLAGIPKNKLEVAKTKLGTIVEFEKFAAAAVCNGGTRTKAMNAFCLQKKVSPRTIYGWIRQYRDHGLIGLVDTRGGGAAIRQISSDAWDLFASLWLDPRQPTVKACWQNVSFVNQQQNMGWFIPTLNAVYRLVAERIPMPVQVLHREGLAAYEARCAPYVIKDMDSVEPGAVWIGDHHQCNCWVRYRNRWVRPWITAWLDMRSRLIIGVDVNASPNQTTIMLAMRRGIERYGPPASVKIDNGKDYDSEMFTGTTKVRRRTLQKGYLDETLIAGIYAMMDIGVSFSIPYHPQSKSIERWFDTMDVQFCKSIPTYCGKDSARRPENLQAYLQSSKAVAEAYSLDDFAGMMATYIKTYNNSAHTGDGMDGRTPVEVMATRTNRRVLRDGVLDLLMRVWSGELTIGKNGVHFKGLWYGQYDTELMMRQGHKVRLAYNPDAMQKVYVYDAVTYKLITIAEQAQLVGYGADVDETALRDAMRKKSRATKTVREYKDATLAKQMDLPSLTLAAMAAATKETSGGGNDNETLRPVATVMDGQIKTHIQKEMQSRVRKAVGDDVITLDMSKLRRESPKKINLFER